MSNESSEKVHVERATCNQTGFIFFIAALASGTLSALTCKIAYETPSNGLDSEIKLFAKPIMMLLLMFFGMIPAIFIWITLPPEQRGNISFQNMVLLAIPSFCDLLCTLLLLVAQLYLTASLWQMMRGSIIVMTAFVKRFGLGHHLPQRMWAGIGILTIALLLVAASSLYQANGSVTSNTDPKLGIGLVMLGCLAQAVQYVFEEKLMRVDNVPPLLVIVCEGCWGAVLTLVVIYPIAYLLPGKDHGSYESPFDAMAMIYNSRLLQILTISFVLSVTAYNCLTVYLTKHLSAIWHAILDSFRPITIWGFSLLIHYFISLDYGEAWVSGSSLQFCGLCFLLFGTAVYNGSVTIPGIPEEEYHELEGEEITDIPLESELAMGAVTLQRSPNLLRDLRNSDDRQRELELSDGQKGKYQTVRSHEV